MSEILNLQALGIGGASVVMFGMLIALLLTGMQLAFVTILVALFFALGWFGPMAVPIVTTRIYSFVTQYVFLSVPMFVLMASVLDRSGIARDLFNAMRLVAGNLRGGLGVQTLFVAVILAAMSGIIGGEIVLLGLLALPQMLRLGYDKHLAIGIVCAGGALGTMIPPSIVLIIYGLSANVSIGEVFTASFVPGLMLAGFYTIYVLAVGYFRPELAPVQQEDEKLSATEKLALLRGLILPIIVVIFVLGSIYGGIASVTEASAIGVMGVVLSTIVRGEFTLRMIADAALQTLRTCGMIVWIGVGATALIGVYNLMGGIDFVESLIFGISDTPIVVLLVMMVILAVLGMFLDWVGIALLTIPIFAPIVSELGYDLIWFGVLFSLNMQISFISPPFGPAAFYLKSVAPPEIGLGTIFISLVPFIGLQVLALGLVIAFPQLALWYQ
ncbi:C4-dicarboxylate ABC transporter permease [Roseivivax halodurans JCM 10272]|uniref:TRAP transporter large permease protein n=1 Tax=Roseivivax halodurans JCM 10272 TaxID=1449350 RepID=X7ELI3_9RHOB|nr:TRAP transporter large permease subunit [Roseivivax halodurans]ETX16036.1 C4-dicarboxylate ABC transporter permease [Roseivivax halodurans JCM 10272]